MIGSCGEEGGDHNDQMLMFYTNIHCALLILYTNIHCCGAAGLVLIPYRLAPF